ncbi:MAG: hypothetical protein ACR2J1_09935 [Methyloceanibacter sp.]|uniref:hypothetical protein n=1 Tax=Methyloceanibacter sp. TaxID=1965321 RepID=UPI003D9B5504
MVDFDGAPDKFERYFSPNPGEGDGGEVRGTPSGSSPAAEEAAKRSNLRRKL